MKIKSWKVLTMCLVVLFYWNFSQVAQATLFSENQNEVNETRIEVNEIQTIDNNSFYLSWDRFYTSEQYKIYEVNKETSVETEVINTKENEATITGVSYGEPHYYIIRSYIIYLEGTEDESISWYHKSKVIMVKTNIGTPTPIVIKKSSTVNKITWNKISGASGYEVSRAKSPNGKYQKIATIGEVSYTDKSVKKNQKYYYKLKALGESGGNGIESNLSQGVTSRSQVKKDYKAGSVYGPSLSIKQLNQVKKKAKAFKSNYIKSSMTEYEKVITIYNYLKKNVIYANTWSTQYANTAWGALVNNRAQCSGFSRAFKCLCDEVGIAAYYVRQKSDDYVSQHQWVVVNVENNWYIFDPLYPNAVGTSNSFYYFDKYYNGVNKEITVPKCKYTYDQIQKKYGYAYRKVDIYTDNVMIER